MSTTDSTTTIEPFAPEHPNADVIAGLRDVADWLQAHPGLPAAHYASISFGYGIAKNARARLTQLADALGDRAEESRYSDTITISGSFRAVRVVADAKVQYLVDAPPLPEYQPIVQPTEIAA